MKHSELPHEVAVFLVRKVLQSERGVVRRLVLLLHLLAALAQRDRIVMKSQRLLHLVVIGKVEGLARFEDLLLVFLVETQFGAGVIPESVLSGGLEGAFFGVVPGGQFELERMSFRGQACVELCCCLT